MGVAEGADQGVGERHPASQVVREARLDQLTDRPFDQRPPQLRIDLAAQVGGAWQRLDQGWLYHRRELGQCRIECTQLTAPMDQNAAVAVRGVGPDRPAPKLQIEPEIVDDHLRQQRYQIGEAGQPRIDTGKHPGTGHRSAQL